mmetsp:Transcript_83557/g.259574  ORF Transcript_83557/g.259574 Transcript_83557/m.259574 type:complete len:276 (-) Transcript_83557:70-897(-)
MAEILSRAPLIAIAKGTLSAAECESLLCLAERSLQGDLDTAPVGKSRAKLLPPADIPEAAAVELLNGRVADLLGVDAQNWSAHRTHTEGAGTPSATPLGLHLDTFHAPLRFATALVYLNCPAEGGGTVFPLAAAASGSTPFPWLRTAELRAVGAAEVLAEAGVQHSHEVSRVFERSDAVGNAIEFLEARAAAAPSGGGLMVRATAGDMLLFFSRTAEGAVDARSWHAGTAVLSGSKWTLQNFMEMPVDVSPTDFAAFVGVRHRQLMDRACVQCVQ